MAHIFEFLVSRKCYSLRKIWRSDFVGVSMILLEQVWVGLGVAKSQASFCVSLNLLLAALCIELSATSPVSWIPASCPAPCHDDNGLNLWHCKQAPVKMLFFMSVTVVMVSFHINITLTYKTISVKICARFSLKSISGIKPKPHDSYIRSKSLYEHQPLVYHTLGIH